MTKSIIHTKVKFTLSSSSCIKKMGSRDLNYGRTSELTEKLQVNVAVNITEVGVKKYPHTLYRRVYLID